MANDLQSTERDRRIAALDRLLALERHGDAVARSQLHAVVRNHRAFDLEIWGRTLNGLVDFNDANLKRALLDALRDVSFDGSGRAHAAMFCGRLGYAEAVPDIEELLDEPDGMVRSTACEALGQLGAVGSTARLAERLDDGHQWTRAAAAYALAEFGTEEALDVLWAALRRRRLDRPHDIANAIASFGVPVVDRLVVLAEGDDPDLRYWAVRALGSIGDHRVVPLLERMAANDHATTASTIGAPATAARRALRTLERRARRRAE